MIRYMSTFFVTQDISRKFVLRVEINFPLHCYQFGKLERPEIERDDFLPHPQFLEYPGNFLSLNEY